MFFWLYTCWYVSTLFIPGFSEIYDLSGKLIVLSVRFCIDKTENICFVLPRSDKCGCVIFSGAKCLMFSKLKYPFHRLVAYTRLYVMLRRLVWFTISLNFFRRTNKKSSSHKRYIIELEETLFFDVSKRRLNYEFIF